MIYVKNGSYKKILKIRIEAFDKRIIFPSLVFLIFQLFKKNRFKRAFMDNESKDLCHREEARIQVAAICPLLNQHLVNSKVCRTATNCVRCLPSRG